MGVGAWIMFIIGATLLWGGLVVAILNYLRAARSGGNND
ncbi:hypothetical protein BH24ACT22_BH24ACT22_10130 [soil metagenome]